PAKPSETIATAAAAKMIRGSMVDSLGCVTFVTRRCAHHRECRANSCDGCHKLRSRNISAAESAQIELVTSVAVTAQPVRDRKRLEVVTLRITAGSLSPRFRVAVLAASTPRPAAGVSPTSAEGYAKARAMQ